MSSTRLLLLGAAAFFVPLFLCVLLWSVFSDSSDSHPVTRTTKPTVRPEPPPARGGPPPVIPVAGDPQSVWAHVERLRSDGSTPPEVMEGEVLQALRRLLVAPTLSTTRDLVHEAQVHPEQKDAKIAEALALLASVEDPPMGRVLPEELRVLVEAEVRRIEALRDE